jgi:hypothetical protein
VSTAKAASMGRGLPLSQNCEAKMLRYLSPGIGEWLDDPSEWSSGEPNRGVGEAQLETAAAEAWSEVVAGAGADLGAADLDAADLGAAGLGAAGLGAAGLGVADLGAARFGA